MATVAEIQKRIDDIDLAIDSIVKTGQSVKLDVLGFRQEVTHSSLNDLRAMKKEYQIELRRKTLGTRRAVSFN